MKTARKPGVHSIVPEQKTYSFPALDRKKLYDVMQKRLANVSLCHDWAQIIREYLKEQGIFKDIDVSHSDYSLPEITSQDFPKGHIVEPDEEGDAVTTIGRFVM